jgi:quinohemoprotein ethanol dehydrogenase
MLAMNRIAIAAALSCALALTACGREADEAGGIGAEEIMAAEGNSDWLSYGRTYSEQRFSPLDQINAETIDDLGQAWYADFETNRGHEATPIVVDGTLYTTTSWSMVFAFDAATGEPKWAYDPQVDRTKGFDACCDVVNRGVAAWGGKVFVGALDGRLIALDADTGVEVWSEQTTDPTLPYTITGAPRVVKGKVIIGNGGAEYGVRGYVTAYDAATGERAWRFYTTPNPEGEADNAASDTALANLAEDTWSGEGWKRTGGGGTAWDAMAYDPDLDLLYIGVGNGTPWNHRERSDGQGDNLFLSSIVAVRPDTGEYVWHYQTTPGESWDYTATQHIMLADLPIGGETRRVVMQAPKNGFFYVLDAADGELISAGAYDPTMNWATGVDLASGRPVETPGARYEENFFLTAPGPYGAHNWHPMAFNPNEGLVYIPVINAPFAYGDPEAGYEFNAGAWNVGISGLLNALPDEAAQREALKAMLGGSLVAWDPVAQEARWTVEHPYFWNAGVLATAGGLVFQGDADGALTAYDAANGEEVWSFEVGQGIVAPPMTYEIGGEQYLAVMVGYGGAAPLAAPAMLPQRPSLPGRLMVFKLGGDTPAPEYQVVEAPPLDLTDVSSAGVPARGFQHYQDFCGVCHGSNASGAFLPDLKRSPMLLTSTDWQAVVHDGRNAARGMAPFARFMSVDEIEDIRAYVLSEARRVEVATDR